MTVPNVVELVVRELLKIWVVVLEVVSVSAPVIWTPLPSASSALSWARSSIDIDNAVGVPSVQVKLGEVIVSDAASPSRLSPSSPAVAV